MWAPDLGNGSSLVRVLAGLTLNGVEEAHIQAPAKPLPAPRPDGVCQLRYDLGGIAYANLKNVENEIPSLLSGRGNGHIFVSNLLDVPNSNPSFQHVASDIIIRTGHLLGCANPVIHFSNLGSK